MIKPAIVVIAYNRDASLRRLLKSLNDANYDSDDVMLVISIDKSEDTKVPAVASAFDWKHGEKRVILREERMGLKNHVLVCGDLVSEYGHIIVLEDDLFVSKDFYSYTCAALLHSEKDARIAGISLYNHQLNVHVREPFEAIDDGFDNYYMQFAQSWGQAYSKEQWQGFKSWYESNSSKPVEADNVPLNVSSWSDKSWLKYYIKYIIEEDKYFIYPRVSYTTNFGDEGTHAKGSVSDLQVSLASKKSRDFCFSNLDDSDAVYDAFFENNRLEKVLLKLLNIEKERITIDLYGYKNDQKKGYVVSSKALPYKVVKSFGRMLRPIDANIINDIEGNDFFVFDTKVAASLPNINKATRVLYNYKALNVNKMIDVIKHRLLNK